MRHLIILVLCMRCVCATAQPAYLLHEPYNIQYHFFDSLRRNEQGATEEQRVRRLQDLEKWATANGDEELADELALQEIQMSGKERADDLTAGRTVDIVIKARNRKWKYLESNALACLGDYWSGKRKHGLAFENHLAAYNIYKNFSREEFPPKQDYLYVLAGHYYHYDDHENAIKYMTAALAVNPNNADLQKPIYNSIGLSYRKMGKYDSSEYYFRHIYELSVAKRDSAWIGIAAGNIGINYFLQKRYDDAMPLLEKDIALSLSQQTIKNAINSQTILAEIYYRKGETGKAEELLKLGLKEGEGRFFWSEYTLAEPIFTLLSKINARRGDMKAAYLYADSALTAKDSVVSLNNALSFAKAKEKTDLVQHMLDEEQLANQKKVQELIRDGLILSIVLLTVIAILFINRQRLKQKKLEADKRNAESELELAAAQLEGFRQSMQEKNRLIEYFTNEIGQLKESEAAETETDVLTQLQHAIILTDEQWEKFRVLFDKVHRNFFVNLKNKMPDLTQAEVRFLALTKLKLSSKEMAGMLGISQNAIRMYRHRLRRKLELDKEELIEGLVDDL